MFPRIRIIMADAGHQSRKLAGQLLQQDGWKLVIVNRGQRAFKVTGLTWIVERSFAWLGRNPAHEQGLRIHGSDFRNHDRPRYYQSHAQSSHLLLTLLKHPLKLESQKGPAPVLVIDRAEKPSAN